MQSRLAKALGRQRRWGESFVSTDLMVLYNMQAGETWASSRMERLQIQAEKSRGIIQNEL